VVLLRTLNNPKDLAAKLAPAFAFDRELGEALQQADRSLFYDRILVGVKQ
jgi:hypothetical protein